MSVSNRLRNADYCTSAFSILVRDPRRPVVIRLVELKLSSIEAMSTTLQQLMTRTWPFITERFSLAVPSISDTPGRFLPSALIEELAPEEVNSIYLQCDNIRRLVMPGTQSELSMLRMLWEAVHLIDLGVLSYSGAHLMDYAASDLQVPTIINLMEPFPGFTNDSTAPMYMQRCHLQCLDTFHDNNPVWVFGSSIAAETQFLLSTPISLFADIWGPVVS